MADVNVEPWLRGTLTEVSAVPRGVLHALQLADEDVTKWCRGLADAELNQRPSGLPSVAFQLRHLARSLDRLLSYAEGKQLSAEQIAALKSEMEDGAMNETLFVEFGAAIEDATRRVRALAAVDLDQPRGVGKKQLPTTVGGLLVHVADHTQRHVGQAITTAKVVVAQRALPVLESLQVGADAIP
jgi:uncharacterized damage-inducible protein DinB